jgi:hypothetical protein
LPTVKAIFRSAEQVPIFIFWRRMMDLRRGAARRWRTGLSRDYDDAVAAVAAARRRADAVAATST